jgi:hypothetical protein
VARTPTPEENGEALVRILDALDVARKAFRACRHDSDALEHVYRAGEELHHAAFVLRGGLSPIERERAEQLHWLRHVDE